MIIIYFFGQKCQWLKESLQIFGYIAIAFPLYVAFFIKFKNSIENKKRV
jgi:hypothetical protein